MEPLEGNHFDFFFFLNHHLKAFGNLKVKKKKQTPHIIFEQTVSEFPRKSLCLFSKMNGLDKTNQLVIKSVEIVLDLFFKYTYRDYQRQLLPLHNYILL